MRHESSPWPFAYLCSQVEAAFGLHHLLQHAVFDPRCADILVQDPVFNMNVVHIETDQRTVVRDGQLFQSSNRT